MNAGQKAVVDAVAGCVLLNVSSDNLGAHVVYQVNTESRVFFLDAPGGTQAIHDFLCLRKKKVIAVAMSLPPKFSWKKGALNLPDTSSMYSGKHMQYIRGITAST